MVAGSSQYDSRKMSWRFGSCDSRSRILLRRANVLFVASLNENQLRSGIITELYLPMIPTLPSALTQRIKLSRVSVASSSLKAEAFSFEAEK
jgi:hypothetical protein